MAKKKKQTFDNKINVISDVYRFSSHEENLLLEAIADKITTLSKQIVKIDTSPFGASIDTHVLEDVERLITILNAIDDGNTRYLEMGRVYGNQTYVSDQIVDELVLRCNKSLPF